MERRMNIGVTAKRVNILPKGGEIADIKTRLLSFKSAR
jgi:hypothetical protein